MMFLPYRCLRQARPDREIIMQHVTGLATLEITDRHGTHFPLYVFYPAVGASRPEPVGPYVLDVARGAAITPGRYPLVLVSHGSGGSPLVYRDLACALAAQGFVVALPEHPGNNRHDNSRNNTLANLRERPGHVVAALEALQVQAEFAGSLRADAVFMIGHSLGGYTALALAGGVPTSLPPEAPDGLAHVLEVAHDARIRALVLLAPATIWFGERGALEAVDLPILMLTGENDTVTPDFFADFVINGVRDRARVQHRVIANAGHFSFMSPFPAPLCNPAFPPSQDPPGFDRAGFVGELADMVGEFLRAQG
jgi:predicted dienelactone hydrolase